MSNRKGAESAGNITKKKSSQSGFTLIELIMVIVILGILAVVAIPKYVDIKRQAIISTMHGLDGALKSAAHIAHARAILDGVHNEATSTITVDGTTVDMVFGYPAGTANGIAEIIETPSGNWKQRPSTYGGAYVYWHGVIDEDAGTANCYIRYRQPKGKGLPPVVDFQDSGC